MKVEPIRTYRRPNYPCIGEKIYPTNPFRSRGKNAALVAAMIAVSGALTGCDTSYDISGGIPPTEDNTSFVEYGGVPPAAEYLTEQEILQILTYEAENLGVAFDRPQDTVVKYFDHDIALDLYNEESQIGVAVVDQSQSNNLYETLSAAGESDLIETLYASGGPAEGTLEDAQPVNFFFAADITEDDEETLRQSFCEFIEWLQSEGII